jgi:hypothetical protein
VTDDYELIRKYEPVLLFSKDGQDKRENFFPMAAEHFVQECRLRRRGGLFKKGQWLDPPQGKTLFSHLGQVKDSKECSLFYAAGDVPETSRLLWLSEGGESELPVEDEWFSRIVAGDKVGDDLMPAWDDVTEEPPIEDPWVEHASNRIARAASDAGAKMSLSDQEQESRKVVLSTLQSVLEEAKEQYEPYRDWEWYPPVYHYHVCEDEDFRVLQYWFLYAYNDWRSHGGINDHEGDWEVIYVFLDNETEELRGVAYSRHIKIELGVTFYGPLRAPWSALQDVGDAAEAAKVKGPARVGTNPVVYVGCGSHASYLERGAHRVMLVWDHARGDDVAIGPGSDVEWGEPVILDVAWNLNFQGRWGAPFGNPPNGPAQKKRGKWDRPADWADVPPFSYV